MTAGHAGYTGRFAPSPTGPLHAGSLVAALASWLDARAHGGRWLVRIEDVDAARSVAGGDQIILAQLAACGLHPDNEVWRQSQRSAAYDAALQRLLATGWAFPCGCSRSEIENALAAWSGIGHVRHGERIYPGTCRSGLHGRPARAVRMLAATAPRPPWASLRIDWHDRRLGAQHQDVSADVGDFVLKRADGAWSYQLAVVVDDAAQQVSDVVRGADLTDNTARQIHLQRALGLPTSRYLHVPLVRGADGEKLSKQNGAPPLDLHTPLCALRDAAAVLGLAPSATDLGAWLGEAVAMWRDTPGWGLPLRDGMMAAMSTHAMKSTDENH